MADDLRTTRLIGGLLPKRATQTQAQTLVDDLEAAGTRCAARPRPSDRAESKPSTK